MKRVVEHVTRDVAKETREELRGERGRVDEK